MTNPYTIKNNLVKGKGHSFQLNNKYDAVHLCNILNSYETQIQTTTTAEQHLIRIQMDISVLKHDIEELKEAIQ